jgi:hypothetical protein
VRLLLSAAGDVVGVEVLGWSQRTASPSEVAISITAVTDVLADDDPRALALLRRSQVLAPRPAPAT